MVGLPDHSVVDKVNIFLADVYTTFGESVDFEKNLSKKGHNLDLNKYMCYSVTHTALKERLLKLRKKEHAMKYYFSVLAKEMQHAVNNLMNRSHTYVCKDQDFQD